MEIIRWLDPNWREHVVLRTQLALLAGVGCVEDAGRVIGSSFYLRNVCLTKFLTLILSFIKTTRFII